MADDAAENTPPEDRENPPSAGPASSETGAASRQPRARESWEVQVRAPRRPDFAPRLAKTSDMPTEVARERQKSKLGEHRAAAIHWEDAPEEKDDADDGGATGAEAEGAGAEPVLTRGQITTLAGLGVVVALLGVMWFAKSLLIGGGAPPLPPAAASGPESADVAASLSDLEYSEVSEVMKKFLEALTPEDLRAVLREPERVWPLVQAHHQRTPWKPFIVRRLPAKNQVQLNRNLLAGEVEVDDFQRFVVAMERTPDGIKVDWETFTGQGEMAWDDLLAKRPKSPVLMRVALRADDYYNSDFADASTHACYQIISHKDTHRIFGYVPRGSPVHAQLASRTRVNPRILATVRLQYPAQSTVDDQVEIVELVADGWLVTEATKIKDIELVPSLHQDEPAAAAPPADPADDPPAEVPPALQ